jgi:hypothetical protein
MFQQGRDSAACTIGIGGSCESGCPVAKSTACYFFIKIFRGNHNLWIKDRLKIKINFYVLLWERLI